jgi:hypothetical protein
MFLALSGLILSCQLINMQPTNYKAELTSLKNNKFNLVLKYQYYGAEFDYKYSLNQTDKGLEGKDKRNDNVVIHSVKKQKNKYSLVIDSEQEGYLEMNCQQKE